MLRRALNWESAHLCLVFLQLTGKFLSRSGTLVSPHQILRRERWVNGYDFPSPRFLVFGEQG